MSNGIKFELGEIRQKQLKTVFEQSHKDLVTIVGPVDEWLVSYNTVKRKVENFRIFMKLAKALGFIEFSQLAAVGVKDGLGLSSIENSMSKLLTDISSDLDSYEITASKGSFLVKQTVSGVRLDWEHTDTYQTSVLSNYALSSQVWESLEAEVKKLGASKLFIDYARVSEKFVDAYRFIGADQGVLDVAVDSEPFKVIQSIVSKIVSPSGFVFQNKTDDGWGGVKIEGSFSNSYWIHYLTEYKEVPDITHFKIYRANSLSTTDKELIEATVNPLWA